MKLREVMWNVLGDMQMINPKIEKFLDFEVEKKFGMRDGEVWLSWQEFGVHKNVHYWYLLEGGYAIGHNENPAIGWSFPIKKLSTEQYKRCQSHTQTYDEYYNIDRD